jgi:hypothetical protein
MKCTGVGKEWRRRLREGEEVAPLILEFMDPQREK